MDTTMLLPVIAALLAGAVSPTLTAWFGRRVNRTGIVSQQAAVIETYWSRITALEEENRGLRERVLQLEAKVGQLLLRLGESGDD